MQNSDGGELMVTSVLCSGDVRDDGTYQERARTQITSGQHNHAQAIRENQGCNRADQARRLGLIPRRGARAEECRTREREQHASHDAGHEDLVEAGVGLCCAGARYNLGRFGRGVAVVHLGGWT